MSPKYTGNSGAWTQPFLDLKPYGGKRVQLSFHVHSANNVASGWYVDDVRLVHDFATLLLDSPIVRTQNTACIPLGIAASSPVSSASFTLQAPAGNLGNLLLTTEGCWSSTVTPQPDSKWSVTLQGSCTTVPMGVETIGSFCFTAVSAHSTFVPLTISDLVVTNLDSSIPATDAFGSRAVNIANEPLLEAWLDTGRLRMATLYGIAGNTYEIRHASTVDSP